MQLQRRNTIISSTQISDGLLRQISTLVDDFFVGTLKKFSNDSITNVEDFSVFNHSLTFEIDANLSSGISDVHNLYQLLYDYDSEIHSIQLTNLFDAFQNFMALHSLENAEFLTRNSRFYNALSALEHIGSIKYTDCSINLLYLPLITLLDIK